MRISLLICLLLVAVLTAGCLSGGSGGTPIAGETGKLLVSASVPEVLQAQGVSAQSVLEEITLKEIIFTISNESSSQSEAVSVVSVDDTPEAVFENLAAGTWTIEVTAIDTEDYVIAEGTEAATVSVGTVTEVTVELDIVPGELIVQLTAPEDNNIASGKVSLLVSNREETFDIASGESEVISFGEVTAQGWMIEAVLYDSSATILYEGQAQIPVLPGRVTTAQVVFDQEAPGGLLITITWNLPPDKPAGVNAVYD